MSLTYRRLNDGLPSAGGEALRRFPSDARSARNWVAALPRANAQAAQMELSDALDSLAGQRLKGTQRLLVLEELRPAVLESVGLMKRQYTGSSLPLPGLKARAAQQAETFQLDMAGAYRKAAADICAPEGAIPMFRGGAVAKALQRSAWHYCQAANLSWRLYRTPAEGVWQGLHRVYRFAAEQRLNLRPPEEALTGNIETVQGLYLQALLMSVANPLAFSQPEQDTLWTLARAFSGLCPLQGEPPDEGAACVPEDADQGPGLKLEEESDPLWLDLRPLADEIREALARSKDGVAVVVPGTGMGIEVAVEALYRLQRAFGMIAARAHRRRLAGHSLQTVFGMSALHFYLAGRRDFDTFVRQVAQHEHHERGRAAWTMAGPDAAKVPMFPARVLDQSLGGYRLSWEQAPLIRARVGELIGLNLADDGSDSDWMLGVVRWLRYEPGDSLSAGVELLTRRAFAIGLRAEGAGAESGKPPVRALALAEMQAGAGVSYLATGAIAGSQVQIGILHDLDGDVFEQLPDQVLADVERALSMADYTMLKPHRDEAAIEAAAVAAASAATVVEAEAPPEPEVAPAVAPAMDAGAGAPDHAATAAEAETAVLAAGEDEAFSEADAEDFAIAQAEADAEAEAIAMAEAEADAALAVMEGEGIIVSVESFAELDEPAESSSEFSTSYELIEPVGEDDEAKSEDELDNGQDYLR